ncbi:DNA polymerase III chi subunit [Volucribacter psittacicida]|uniref:DNA polymerase III chi subunit n=1 Tax=Volucribacter psittacicida TaxID=203482 RepID=A0A4R1G2K7_9PAST|nr:DNA polymerase III subunit chi [Volucribacter psittacicida]TCJ97921.1 DNA polymerase III chi subunit [Volucribacter psittacicida]
MNKQATFYLMQQEQSSIENLTAIEALACELAAKTWRLGKRILIACETEQQAFKLDEALWQRDPDEFVPHNLSGEISHYTTPIEICWKEKRNVQRRDVLISLQQQIPEFAQMFNHVIDFVPEQEQQKNLARERYKQYRQLGFQMNMEQQS